MSVANICTRFLEYNLWANERITSWLLTCDQDRRAQPTGSSFGTIDLTMQHIACAQQYWCDVILEGKITEFPLPDTTKTTEKIIGDLISTSRRLIDGISGFNNEQLMEVIPASDSRQPRYNYMLHVVNHSTYHRGQIVTMCRALGIPGEIPVTDYDAYLWWLENM